MKSRQKLTVGIDAANLRRGGGVTHLVELLRAAQPELSGVERIVIWGGSETLNAVQDRPWIEKCKPLALDGGLIHRALWQRFELSQAARRAGCDVLFVPGGSYGGDFHPVVTMSRNLLPFELKELARYGWSFFTFKLLLLRFIQCRSYRRADGIIFLTDYARRVVTNVTGSLRGKTCTISHGISSRFAQAPRLQREISDCDDVNPFRIIYVSIIDQYKHQWHVVEAIATLRQHGFPVVLDLFGPANPSALKRLNETLDSLVDANSWIQYHGAVPFDELHLRYAQADLGLFASSCENMPNILLETMASGLPIACSNCGPMPEVLGSGGVYFNPENPNDIAHALRILIESPQLREQLAEANFKQSEKYSWHRCAEETFRFLAAFAK